MPARSMQPRLSIIAMMAALAASVVPGEARAQDPGVHVDPDSPTGKEYAIPLDSARRETSGSTSRPGQPAPLFGAGVTAEEDAAPPNSGGTGTGTPGGGGATPHGGAGTSSSSPVPGAGSGAERKTPTAAERAIETATREPGAPDGGMTGALVAGGGLLVILTGLAAGITARRRSAGADIS